MSERKFKAGTILHLESGDYSDRGTVGLLVALRDIDLDALADEWIGTLYRDDRMEGDTVSETTFIGWLCAQQYCAGLEHEYLHVGDTHYFEVGSDSYGANLMDYSSQPLPIGKGKDNEPS